MFESLESRRLFTTVGFSGGVLTVTGGASDDLITVSEDQGAVHVEWSTANTEITTADYDGVTAINITGGRGDDAIYYQGNSVGANIHGDGATDNSGGNGGNGGGNNGHHNRDCDFRGGRDRHHCSWHQEIFNKFRCGNNGRGGILGLLFGLLNKLKGNDNNGNNMGNDGDDQITVTDAGTGSSILDGDGGNDSLTVVVGNNTHVLGGAGSDNMYLNTGVGLYDMTNASTIVDGEDGNDTFTTYAGSNAINGGKGKDTLIDLGGTNTLISVETIV